MEIQQRRRSLHNNSTAMPNSEICLPIINEYRSNSTVKDAKIQIFSHNNLKSKLWSSNKENKNINKYLFNSLRDLQYSDNNRKIISKEVSQNKIEKYLTNKEAGNKIKNRKIAKNKEIDITICKFTKDKYIKDVYVKNKVPKFNIKLKKRKKGSKIRKVNVSQIRVFKGSPTRNLNLSSCA